MTTVYVTAPAAAAQEIATALVSEKLAACVNRVECDSTFRWEGEVVSERETVLIVKTVADRYGELESRIEEIHPYEVPCIERFEETDRAGPFAEWVEESVR